MGLGPMLQKAYSLVTVKGFDPDKRTFEGIATSPVADRVGDTIASEGVTYKNPLALLLYHDSRKPVGEARFRKWTKDGTPFDALISTIDRPGIVSDRLQEAVDSLNAKPPLIRGVSIGFVPLADPIYNKESGGFHYPKIEVHELSMVVIPMHQDATIATVKSLDAASGVTDPTKPAGASAPSRVVSTRRETPMKKSYADQIVEFQNTRAAKAAKMDAILEKSAENAETLDAAEKETHDTLARDLTEIDEHLDRLVAADKREKAAALPVRGTTPAAGTDSRGSTRITVEKKLPPGIAFARYARCMALSHGNELAAVHQARKDYGDDAEGIVKLIELVEKGAVGALNAQTAGSGSELVPYTIMDDFIEFLRPRTIIGKFGTNGIPSLRRVPFNTRVSGFSAGATAAWVGEGLPVLLSKGTSITATLGWAKIAALVVLTKEEVRFSNPGAESKVRDDMAAAVIQKQDLDFIDPAKAAVANVSPASVTWNTTPVVATGTTAATLRTDLATLLATFGTAKIDPSGVVLIMSTIDALNLSLMITSLGNPVFPGLTMAGGNLLGFHVITTEATVSIGSPVSSIIVAVAANEVYLADDGVVTVDGSDQASIEMVDASSVSGLTGTGASVVSMFQTNMLALKATREINWLKRRSAAARYIYNAAYRA